MDLSSPSSPGAKEDRLLQAGDKKLLAKKKEKGSYKLVKKLLANSAVPKRMRHEWRRMAAAAQFSES